jgi:hypothetical protein
MPAPAFAQPDKCGPLKRIATLPIEYIENDTRPLVPVTINGTPARMLFDTGGNVTSVAVSVVQRLGLKPLKSNTALHGLSGRTSQLAVKLDSFGIGPLRGDEQHFQIAPDDVGGDWEPYDGILANDVLQQYDIDLDFDANAVNLFATDHCPGNVVYWKADGVAVVPFEIYAKSSIAFPVTLDGKKLLAVLDTGAFNTTLDQSDASGFSASQFKELSFPGVTVKNPKIYVRPFKTGLVRTVDLLLGMNVLRQLHIYIAMQERKVYISPRATPLPALISSTPKDFWQAATGSGCKLFASNPRKTDRVEWSGSCQDGFATGEGTKTVRGYGGRLERAITGTYSKGCLEGPVTVRYPSGRTLAYEARNGVFVTAGRPIKPCLPPPIASTLKNDVAATADRQTPVPIFDALLGRTIIYPGYENAGLPSLESLADKNGEIDTYPTHRAAPPVAATIRPPSATPIAESAPKLAISDGALDQAKRKCTELGFKPKTEKFGTCVLTLSK